MTSPTSLGRPLTCEPTLATDDPFPHPISTCLPGFPLLQRRPCIPLQCLRIRTGCTTGGPRLLWSRLCLQSSSNSKHQTPALKSTSGPGHSSLPLQPTPHTRLATHRFLLRRSFKLQSTLLRLWLIKFPRRWHRKWPCTRISSVLALACRQKLRTFFKPPPPVQRNTLSITFNGQYLDLEIILYYQPYA